MENSNISVNKQVHQESFAQKLINNAVRSVYPSFRQSNPYVYKMDERLTKRVNHLYKKEVSKKRRTFKFMNKRYSIDHHHLKIANLVFKNTDRNNTMLGCFEQLYQNYGKKKHITSALKDNLYLFLKFLTLAHSPILNVDKNDKNFAIYRTVRCFFLYIASNCLNEYSGNFWVKNSHIKLGINREYSLFDYFLKNYKKVNTLENSAFDYLSDSFEDLNGSASVLRKSISSQQSINYYNYSCVIASIFSYMFLKNDKESIRFAYTLGLCSSLKLELALFKNEKSSLSSLSTLNDKKYNAISLFWSKLLNDLIKLGRIKNIKLIDFVYSVLTESENKIWLKDEPKMSSSAIIALIINYLFMIVWAIIILYPLGLLLKLTVNEASLISLNTTVFEFSFKNFEFLFEETLFLTWAGNTFAVAFATAGVVTLFCSLLAYAYSRFDFKGKKTSIGGVMIFQMIPAGLALVVFIIYGRFFTDELALEGSHILVLIIIYSGGAIAGNTFLLKGYMDTISADVFDAARIDGCSHMKVFWTIAVPLAKPMMAVIFLWSFVGPFFDFLLPTILSGNVEAYYTMAAGLNTLIVSTTSGNYSPGAYAAGGLLVAVPFAILFLSLNKQIVSGLTAGAVK